MWNFHGKHCNITRFEIYLSLETGNKKNYLCIVSICNFASMLLFNDNMFVYRDRSVFGNGLMTEVANGVTIMLEIINRLMMLILLEKALSGTMFIKFNKYMLCF